MDTIIESFLYNQKFSKTDVLVYLDIFRYGQSVASTISSRTGVDRTTVYSALKRLLKRGFIIQTRVNEVASYSAVSPEVFIDKLDNKIEDLTNEKKGAMFFVEALKKMQKTSFVQPKIRIFEGAEAIIELYSQTLVGGKTQKSFLTLKHIPNSLKDFLRVKFIKLKKKKGVFSKVLVADTLQAERYKALDNISNRETKIVKGHPFDLHSEIVLFGQKHVAIIDFHQQIYGMVIESETFYKTAETLFDFVWSV